MWIKICGMTTADAVAAAVDVEVDAIGFVFADSSRQLTPQRAAQLAHGARGRVRCVAVSRHPTQAAVDEILTVFAPDVLQTELSDLARLRLPTGLELLPVVRSAHDVGAMIPARLLFEGAVSGSGIASDWNAAAALAGRGAALRRRRVEWCRGAAGGEERGRDREFCRRGARSNRRQVRARIRYECTRITRGRPPAR